MALTTHLVGAPQQYPWGHVVRVVFRDEGLRHHHDEIVWKTAPDAAAITARVESARVALEARLAAQALEPVEVPAERKIDTIIPHVLSLVDQLRALADYVVTLPASAPRTRIVGELLVIRDTLEIIRDTVKAVR